MAVATPVTTASLTRGFATLFAGREDVFGADYGAAVEQPLDMHGYNAHLNDSRRIGVYPQRDGNVVKWGCSDIDEKSYALAYNVFSALRKLGITSFIELTKSAHYHVWVFAREWVPAASMRRALLVAHTLADVKAREVNPKQEELTEKKPYGNYVRLPYPGGLNGVPERQVILRQPGGANGAFPGGKVTLEFFLRKAYASLTPPSALDHAAGLWTPPEPSVVEFGGQEPPEVDKALTTRLNGLGWTVFRDGPLDGDRSNALAKLAHACHDSQLTPTEALVVVADADRRWGKFSDRPDGDEQLRKLVERAYT